MTWRRGRGPCASCPAREGPGTPTLETLLEARLGNWDPTDTCAPTPAETWPVSILHVECFLGAGESFARWYAVHFVTWERKLFRWGLAVDQNKPLRLSGGKRLHVRRGTGGGYVTGVRLDKHHVAKGRLTSVFDGEEVSQVPPCGRRKFGLKGTLDRTAGSMGCSGHSWERCRSGLLDKPSRDILGSQCRGRRGT